MRTDQRWWNGQQERVDVELLSQPDDYGNDDGSCRDIGHDLGQDGAQDTDDYEQDPFVQAVQSSQLITNTEGEY